MVDKIRIDNKAVGQRIRKEREKFDLSREEFAEIIGLSDYCD
jgi:transcriptional regulator with XRE-family HTH domain